MREARRSILIVEDQPILGMELELALESAGFEVVGVACDRDQALRLGEQLRPELALVDINLADGRTGLKAAAALVRDWNVSVLFLTGEPELIPEGYAGALGAMAKPYTSDAVEVAVRWCLRIRDGEKGGSLPPGLTPAPWLGSTP